jgi:putative transcriptional regulator
MSDSRKKTPAKPKKAAQKKSKTAKKTSAAKASKSPAATEEENLPFYRKHIAIIEGVGYILLAILMFSVPQLMIRHPNSLAGQILVAAPYPENHPSQPLFGETVILMTKHTRRMAHGFIVNRPLESMSARALYKKLDIPAPGRSASLWITPAYADEDAEDAPKEGRSYLSDTMERMSFPVYWGGPVDEDEGHLLFLDKEYSKSKITRIPDTNVSFTDKMKVMNNVLAAYEEDDVTPYKIAFGHAQWGPGQLDEELKDGRWQVVPYKQEIVFSDNPKGLWNELQKRLAKSTETGQEDGQENTGK